MSEKEVLQTLLEAANGKITDLTAEVTNLASKLADAQAEVLSMHRRLASESLRADQGWERYENANCDRNSLRAAIAAPVVQVAGGDQHPAWSRMVLYTDTIGGNQTCRDDLWAITSGELRELLAAKVSARAADALDSQPTELPNGWELVRSGLDIHLKHANGRWCGYSVGLDSPAHRMTYDFLADLLPASSQPTEWNDAIEAAVGHLEQMGESLGDHSAYNNCEMTCCDSTRMRALSDAASAVLALKRPSSQPTDGEVRNG